MAGQTRSWLIRSPVGTKFGIGCSVCRLYAAALGGKDCVPLRSRPWIECTVGSGLRCLGSHIARHGQRCIGVLQVLSCPDSCQARRPPGCDADRRLSETRRSVPESKSFFFQVPSGGRAFRV